jgi:hypothetical protein
VVGEWRHAYGSVGKEKRAGRSFSLHVEASASEEMAKRTTAAEIDVGGRFQRAAAASSVWRKRNGKEAGRLGCGVKGGRGRPWELFYRLVGAGREVMAESNGHQWPMAAAGFDGNQGGGLNGEETEGVMGEAAAGGFNAP